MLPGGWGWKRGRSSFAVTRKAFDIRVVDADAVIYLGQTSGISFHSREPTVVRD